MNTIQSHWEDYRRRVLPKDAGPVQIRETQMAFYAGAWAVFRILKDGVADTKTDEAGVAMLMGLQEECQAFARSVVGPEEGS